MGVGVLGLPVCLLLLHREGPLNSPLSLGIALALSLGLLRACAPSAATPPVDPLRRDPVFWLGLGFALLLLTQTLNAGRGYELDWSRMDWRAAPPPRPGWPAMFLRRDALEAWRGFLPAWFALLVIRRHRQRARLRRFWRQGLIVITGFVGLICATRLWATAQAGAATASPPFPFFGYPNQAGSLCALGFGLALGEWVEHYQAGGRRLPSLLGAGLAACACFAGAHASGSRGAMLMTWGLLFAAGWLLLSQGFTRLAPARRINRLALLAGGLALVFFLVDGVLHQRLREEFVSSDKTGIAVAPADGDTAPASARRGTPWDTLTRAWSGQRAWGRELAVWIWLQHPYTGAGFRAPRHFAALFTPRDQWAALIRPGAAHIHNDPMQLLCEFGLLGAALVGAALVCVAAPCLRPRHRGAARAGVLLPNLALLALLGQSLFDLPFQSPALLLCWVMVLALQSARCRRLLQGVASARAQAAAIPAARSASPA